MAGLVAKEFASVAARELQQQIRSFFSDGEKEVEKLQDNLESVKAVLNDAEKGKVTGEAEKLWLKRLEDVCYEMDDVVDEWNTAMIKLEIKKDEENAEKGQVTGEAVKLWLKKLEDVVDNTAMIKSEIKKDEEENADGSEIKKDEEENADRSEIKKDEEENADNALLLKKKVCSFIPSPSCCFRRVDKPFWLPDIRPKIRKVSDKLDEVLRERERYGFELTTRSNASEVVARPITTSFVDVSDICGRDNLRDDLVSILLGKGSEEERSPHVISLVGMGGIGKTTLAQLAYHDPKVQAHFEKRMWVCVSDPFDQCRVAKEIIKALGGDHHYTSTASLLEEICELVGGKKFFLVLDDVWNEDSRLWEQFRLALKNGAQGSRILVTTPKSTVAEIMGSTSASMIYLGVMFDDDCWLMFSKKAFSMDPGQFQQLEDLGRQMAKKCKGLPLAAKTLGSLMHSQRNREEWKNVLDSNLWELEVVEKDLFAGLFWSYNDMPSLLKPCFSYCAFFPKDYVFDIDELVFMWMAQGYIDSRANMEIIGREYFENLATRSFFLDFKKDKHGNIRWCKMHDIVHDFAQLMAKNECFTINSDRKLGSDHRNALHLHLEIPEESKFHVFDFNAIKLRTLTLEVPRDFNLAYLFQHLRCLRALTLKRLDGTTTQLPDAIETLIHLRYLNLSNYNVDRLPETICNLCNLQSLKIYIGSSCGRFNKFFQGMHKLINLRHFILEGHLYRLTHFEFPSRIGRLTSLRRLSHFVVSGKDDSKRCDLGKLKNLNQLQGSLGIRGLGNVVDVHEAKNAQLKKKIHLRDLELWFDRENEERMENDQTVLNAIEPPPNLESLTIGKYHSTTISLDLTMSFTKLKMLKLGYLEKLEHLPPLGKLSFLEALEIWQANSLRKVGIEFLGIESEDKRHNKIKLFPNLKSLEFHNLFMWEEWIGIGGMREEEEDSSITIMPRLQFLRIWSCPKLSLPKFLRTTPLKTLVIRSSPILHKRCQRGTGEDWPKISHIPNIVIEGKDVQRDSHEVNYSEFDYWEDVEEYSDEEEHAEEEFDKEEDDKEEFDKEEDDKEEFDKEELLVNVDKVHPRLIKSDPVTGTLGECGQSSSSAYQV